MSEHSSAARSAYDKLATVYDRRWRRYIERSLESIDAMYRPAGNERLLDIGCGTGELARRLFCRYPDLQITGVDVSPCMLQQAKAKQYAGRVSFQEADARYLPFDEHAFDAAVSANSFHYFRSPVDCLAEIRRVLRPGGVFILVDWCDDYLVCKLCSLWLRLADPAFHRTYSVKDCKRLLAETGFEVRRADRFRIDLIWGLMRIVTRRN